MDDHLGDGDERRMSVELNDLSPSQCAVNSGPGSEAEAVLPAQPLPVGAIYYDQTPSAGKDDTNGKLSGISRDDEVVPPTYPSGTPTFRVHHPRCPQAHEIPESPTSAHSTPMLGKGDSLDKAEEDDSTTENTFIVGATVVVVTMTAVTITILTAGVGAAPAAFLGILLI